MLLVLALAGRVNAQSNSGDITGTITDATGATVPNATVSALNEATAIKTTATTNGEGIYRFTNLPIGSYTVSASASGFTAAALKGVAVDLNKVATSNLTLSVGTASTTVEVSASSAVIDTTTAQLQNTFSTTQPHHST